MVDDFSMNLRRERLRVADAIVSMPYCARHSIKYAMQLFSSTRLLKTNCVSILYYL